MHSRGDFAAAGAGSGAVLVGWLITGIGMLGLCLAFYYLNKLKPELKGGVYSYARAGFGSYVGFNSAWGYWLSELLSNISFLTLLFASVGQFLPLFGVGNNIPSVIGMSVVWWIAIILVLRGTKESTAVNLVSTIAKIIPILVLIVVIIFARAFSFETFMQNFSGSEGGMSFGKQVMATTTTTVWAFTGIEGAVVISGRAKRSSDVGRATVIGFLSVLILYIIISFLSAGVMTNEELAALGNPPMAGILEHVVGPWGAALVNIAVIISLLGATLATPSCARSAHMRRPRAVRSARRLPEPIKMARLSSPLSSPASLRRYSWFCSISMNRPIRYFTSLPPA